jgi:hypothetical protein
MSKPFQSIKYNRGGIHIKEDVVTSAMSNLLWAYDHGRFKYMDEFIRQYKSAADMLILGIFPDAKEITESFGAFNAVRTKLKKLHDLNDPKVTLISVGDGRTPRTATLFAFKTKWQCISVDPNLNQDKIPLWESKIERLHCVSLKVEDLEWPVLKGPVIIVAVHSHAPLQQILNHIKATQRSLVVIPCCVKYDYNKTKCIEYTDAGINSPKNLVKVWKSI